MIEIKDIEKLAELSRVKISSSEKEAFLKDIGSVLEYVDQIKKVAGESIDILSLNDTKINIFREDENCHKTGEFTEALIDSAPKKEDGYIKVKKIL